MPEPVVIIGPASGPAGPAPGRAEATPDHVGEEQSSPAAPAGPSIPRRILGSAAHLFGRVFLWVAITLLSVVRQNPRSALAATASFLILGGIWYTQILPGKGTHTPPTNAIGGKTPGSSAKDSKIASAPGDSKPPSGDGSAASSDGAANPTPVPSTVAALSPPVAPKTNLTGASSGNDSGTSATKSETVYGPPAPAPAPTGGDEPILPAPAVAQAPTPESAPKSASSPGDGPGEITKAPVPQPAPEPSKDVTNATLLPGPPAPATSVAQSDSGHSDSPKTKADSVFDNLAPAPTASTALPLAAPLPGEGASKSVSETETAAKDQKHDEGSSIRPSPAPDKQEGPPAELKAKGETPPDQLRPTQTASGDSKIEPLVLPDPTSVKANTASPADAQPDATKPDTSKAANSALETSGQPAKEQPSPERKPLPLAPLDNPAVSAGATGSGSPSDPSPAKPSEAGSNSGAHDEAAPSLTERSSLALKEPVPAIPDSRDTLVNSGGSETPAPAGAVEARTSPQVNVDKDGARWIPIPNTGKIPVDGSDEPEAGAGKDGDESDANRRPARDPRAHAAKDMSFEPASSQSDARTPEAGDPARALTGASAVSRTASATAAVSGERVEAVPHVVERDENYWTISRLYYNSGRYYRALWKSNHAKYPDINVLHVGDVIMIPAIEDLDPAFIDPARSPAPKTSVAKASRGPASPDSAASGRARQSDPDLDLPAPANSPRLRLAARGSRRPAGVASDGGAADDSQPEVRTVARPQSIGAAPRRPVYKVRQYDTLRSIARDTLGDARRSGEILDLNRDLIDDPAQLIIGQVLELPEDARTSVRRAASR
jgi:nucleoid-associated protein YgaU